MIRRGHILVAGYVLFLVYAYPGFMSTDSVEQLLQARRGHLNDWYPPMMSLLWQQTDRVVAGPFPMLVIQSVTFLLGVDGILRRGLPPRAAAIASVCILLFPPVSNTMAVIWKDSQMGGFLVASIACLLSPNRRWQWAGVALASLATAQRYNAPLATLPPIVLLFVVRAPWTRWRRYLAAAGVWAALTAVAFGANALATDEEMHPWHNSVAFHDIAGTILEAKMAEPQIEKALADVRLHGSHDLKKRLHQTYSTAIWWYLANGEGRVFELCETADDRAHVAAAWWHLVKLRPGAYLRHRWHVFEQLIGLGESMPVSPYWEGFTALPFQEDVLAHRASHSAVQRAWLDTTIWLSDTWLFRPHTYAILALILLPLCRRDRLAGVLLGSGLLYEAGLFIIAPSSDLRYSHWMIACVAITLPYLVWRRMRPTAPGSSPSG